MVHPPDATSFLSVSDRQESFDSVLRWMTSPSRTQELNPYCRVQARVQLCRLGAGMQSGVLGGTCLPWDRV